MFGALLEFAFVNYITNANVRRLKKKPVAFESKALTDGDEEEKAAEEAAKSRANAKRVDKIARVVFPLVFVLFNIVYWSYYLGFYENFYKVSFP